MTIEEIRKNAPQGATHYHPNNGLAIYVKKLGVSYAIWNDLKNDWIYGSTTFNLMKEFSPNLKPL